MYLRLTAMSISARRRPINWHGSWASAAIQPVDVPTVAINDRAGARAAVDGRTSGQTPRRAVSASDAPRVTPAWILIATDATAEPMIVASDRPLDSVAASLLDTVLAAIRHVTDLDPPGQGRATEPPSARPARRLTRRERDVVAGVVAGRSNDEIAVELHLARKTVEAYLTRLYERFEIGGRTELALLAQGEGWELG